MYKYPFFIAKNKENNTFIKTRLKLEEIYNMDITVLKQCITKEQYKVCRDNPTIEISPIDIDYIIESICS